MLCSKCGKENIKGTNFCTNCGSKLNNNQELNQNIKTTTKKKKSIKIIAIILISIVIFTFVILKMIFMRKPNTVDMMVNHISEKYDIEFEYAGPIGGSTAPEMRRILVNADGYPEEKIQVTYREKDGKQIFEDNFLSVKYQEQTKQLINEALTECIGADLFLSYESDINGFTKGSSADMSFEEFVSLPSSNVEFTAVVSQNFDVSDHDSIQKEIEKAFLSHGIACQGQIFFDDGVWDFGSKDVMNVVDYYAVKGYSEMLVFDIDTENGLTRTDWE